MKKNIWWIASLLIIAFISVLSRETVVAKKKQRIQQAAFKVATSQKDLFNNYIDSVYQTAQLAEAGLDVAVFQKAVTGYYNLKMDGKLPANSTVVTVVDFTKSSRTKRMWIIDLMKKKLLVNTWVAHGQGSGDDMANQFSNTAESHQSSLGFYITDDIYFGKHGRSLHLNGMDAGFNDKARSRDIVVHAADYVCEKTIAQLGRIGRSFGCPAVSPLVSNQVIDIIKGKSVLFINGNDQHYSSKYLNADAAANFALAPSKEKLATI
jgi:hypothetical protein